jgi:RNA polymerase sigma-70 factor, ECF subfamily
MQIPHHLSKKGGARRGHRKGRAGGRDPEPDTAALRPPTDPPTRSRSELQHRPDPARRLANGPTTDAPLSTLQGVSREPTSSCRPQTNAGTNRPSNRDLVTLSSADLYRRLRPRVKRLVTCLLGGRTAPADLVHDACAEIVMSKGRFRQDAEFGPWINAIVRRQVHKWLRAQRRSHCLLRSLAEQAEARLPRPDELAEAKRALRDTADGLRSLPSMQQKCILALAVDGLSVREAAERLRTTPAAFRTAVCRARARLCELLTIE